LTLPAENAERDRWNARFAADGFVFGTEPNAFLASQLGRLSPGMRALCVADGEGRNSVWLARQGLEVTAFDFSPVGLAKAMKLARQNGVKVDYRQADVNEWDWDAARYDVVVAIFVQFTPPAERSRMFEGMIRALKPGGLLILQGYRPEQLKYATGGPKRVENLYTEPLLRESFAALEILHLASHDEVVDEGAGHKGMSALIDLVARRHG
jgi:2-polyprenyl-3-methyl-5-hydroxy-6-metoxy-1,4-benzoquinol methylase